MVVLFLFVILALALAFYAVFFVALCKDRVSHSIHPIYGRERGNAAFAGRFGVITQTERYTKAA
jgi:hypothetical protein